MSWHWPNAQPDLPIETICQISIASESKPSLPILISQEGPNLPKSANWVPAHYVPAHCNLPIWYLPIGNLPIIILPTMPSHVPFTPYKMYKSLQNVTKLSKKMVLKHILSRNWRNTDLRALVGRFSSISQRWAG